MRCAWLLVTACALVARADTQSFDCAMRQLAIEYAQMIQPDISSQTLQWIADALNGSPEFGQYDCAVAPTTQGVAQRPTRMRTFPIRYVAGNTYYADAVNGNDSNDGSIGSPFRSIARGIAATRAGRGAGAVTGAVTGGTVVLRAGTFYLPAADQGASTLYLSTADSGLTVQAYPGEEVWISGASPLPALQWSPYNGTAGGGGGGNNGYSNDTIIFSQNAVFNECPSPPAVVELNGTDNAWPSYAWCQKTCHATPNCTAFVQHGPDHGPWSFKCCLRTDGQWKLTPDTNVVSGLINGGGGGGPNIWSAPLPRSALLTGSAPGLRFNGSRLIRARFPNADPEQGFGSSLVPAWTPPAPVPFWPTVYTPSYPNRTDVNNGYGIQYYTTGYYPPGTPDFGGCSSYSPQGGFWCSNVTMRFGGFSAIPRWPSGMHIDAPSLPNAPYANASTGVVHAWRSGHWFTRMHAVAGFDATAYNFTFGRGGFQGGEGTDADDEAYIENILEELDAVGEWFYDEAGEQLIIWWNSTNTSANTPPPATGLSAPQLQVLVNITAPQSAPAVDIAFLGLGFRDAAYTYLAPHGMPSSGDWALARTGSVFVEGAEGFTAAGCTWERVDGTALFLSGYNRGANISGNEFAWLGESAIALWGYGHGTPVPGYGWDLTQGDQPRGTVIAGNIAREIGIWQKQSSFVFQAEAGLSSIHNNIAFNGPRAGINFNEDSIGGNNVTYNLIFNMCRESGDHGPMNSWGRTAYVHDAAGYPSTQKLWDTISYNFWIANYNAMAAIDNDDASGYYDSHHNFFSYSPFMLKSDFGGHDNLHHDSVAAYLRDTDWFDGPAAIWITFGAQYPGHRDAFYNNLVVQDWCAPTDPGQACAGSNFSIGETCANAAGGYDPTLMYNNTYYLPATATAGAGAADSAAAPPVIYECGVPIEQYQAACPTCDPGSVAVAGWPEDAVILNAARAALGMPPAARDGAAHAARATGSA